MQRVDVLKVYRCGMKTWFGDKEWIIGLRAGYHSISGKW